jgi:hypothetical protein
MHLTGSFSPPGKIVSRRVSFRLRSSGDLRRELENRQLKDARFRRHVVDRVLFLGIQQNRSCRQWDSNILTTASFSSGCDKEPELSRVYDGLGCWS